MGCWNSQVRSMTDSLRRGAIEATAKKVVMVAKDMRRHHISIMPRRPFAFSDSDGLQRLDTNDVARLALDALLDYLTEHADEWAEMFPGAIRPYETTRLLIAVLREGSTSKEGE